MAFFQQFCTQPQVPELGYWGVSTQKGQGSWLTSPPDSQFSYSSGMYSDSSGMYSDSSSLSAESYSPPDYSACLFGLGNTTIPESYAPNEGTVYTSLSQPLSHAHVATSGPAGNAWGPQWFGSETFCAEPASFATTSQPGTHGLTSADLGASSSWGLHSPVASSAEPPLSQWDLFSGLSDPESPMSSPLSSVDELGAAMSGLSLAGLSSISEVPSLVGSRSSLMDFPNDISDGLSVGSRTRKVRKYTTLEGAKYVCETCGKPFDRKSNYRQHLNTHAPDRYRDAVYKCPKPGCKKRFPKLQDCERHIQSCCRLSKKFYCEYRDCQMAFHRKDVCNRHIKSGCPKKKEAQQQYPGASRAFLIYKRLIIPTAELEAMTVGAKRLEMGTHNYQPIYDPLGVNEGVAATGNVDIHAGGSISFCADPVDTFSSGNSCFLQAMC